MSTGGTRAARQEHARQEILTAAAGLLAASGYHGMAMRDLARATRMSLANLYNYFRSKDDLAFALQRSAFETMIATAGECVRDVDAPDARLYAFILNHVRYVTTHTDVMRVLVEEAGELPPARRRTIRDLKERYFRIGRDLVAGAGSGGTALEIDRRTYNVFGMLNWIYAWYRPGRHGAAQEIARSVYGMTMSGLAANAPDAAAMLAGLERRVEHVKLASPIARARW